MLLYIQKISCGLCAQRISQDFTSKAKEEEGMKINSLKFLFFKK